MNSKGDVLQTSQSSDVNTNFVAFEQAQQAVQAAVASVLQAAGVPGGEVGLCVSSLVGPRFGGETFSTLIPNAVYRYFNERDVAFARAGIYEPHGVAVVAATGATAWGVRKDDERVSVNGGWGSLLGDEGSGFALGLLGLRAAVRAFEGRASESTQLVGAICQHFGLDRTNFRRELIHLAYQKPLSRVEIAGFAPLVTHLAQQGDLLAVHITQKVSNDLMSLVLHTVRDHFEPDEAFDLVVAGGLTNAGDLVLAPLRECLIREFPRSVFHIGTEASAVALGRLALHDITHKRRNDAHRPVFSSFTSEDR
jgi:N-acetylglucosamine kinase-like BadF-type ATPase